LITKKNLFASALVISCLTITLLVLILSNSSPATANAGWNVTTVGTIGTFVDRTHGQTYLKGVLFNNNLVFWRVINSSNFAITSFSLTDLTFKDAFNFTAPWGTVLGKCSPTDMKIIDDAVFAVYGYVDYPVFNTTILKSTDLETWTTYCVSHTVFAESIEQYTGPGILNGFVVYGGYRSDGPGTYSIIEAWNSTSNSEVTLFRGTVYGSDDVTYLKMYNSTCMIGGDAYPYDVLYTNDGQNWTDPYTGVHNTAQYPFDWGWKVEVRNGSAYTTAKPYSIATGHGGLVKWNGTATPFDYGKTIASIANGLIGGCEGLYNIQLTDFPGPAAIYQYNLDGTLGSLIWRSTYTGSVCNLIYDSSSGAWYGFVLRRTVPQSVTIIKMTQHAVTIGFSHGPTVAWVGESVLFDATDGYDNYTWDFGDGNITASGPAVNHVFESVGNFTVTLEVTVGDVSNSTSGTVTVTFITDLDKDGRVDVLDLSPAAKAYGSKPGDPNWNPLADIDKNGIIDIIDMSMVVRDYGKTI
jgi:hypothetical protein